MRKLIYTAAIAVSAFVLVESCSKSSSGGGPSDGGSNGGDKGASFDRKAMLTNMSTNIILPAYTTYQTNINNLNTAVTAFTAAPDVTKLAAAQAAFKTAYLQWQSTSEFNFGPAADANLGVSTNTYPTNIDTIESNIKRNVYDPGLLTNLPAKGLPAIDYLLFSGTDNNAIVAKYDANRKNYLNKLSAELKTNTDKVVAAWNGSYKTTFLNATGTDVGSSTGQLINQLVADYELLKNYEIGVPAGVQTMGNILPQKVQAYYSKISVQLALAHLQAVQDIYTGKDGQGLDDYLVTAKAKYTDGSSLNDTILKQFAAAKAKLQVLTDPLADNIKASPAAANAAYAELQKLTVLLKTDMTSSLGILITFGDNDGD